MWPVGSVASGLVAEEVGEVEGRSARQRIAVPGMAVTLETPTRSLTIPFVHDPIT